MKSKTPNEIDSVIIGSPVGMQGCFYACAGAVGPKLAIGGAVNTGYQYTFDGKKLVLKLVNNANNINTYGYGCISIRDCR